jgi:hypothetical protein
MLWRRRSCPTPPTTHDRPRAHGHHRYPRAPPGGQCSALEFSRRRLLSSPCSPGSPTAGLTSLRWRSTSRTLASRGSLPIWAVARRRDFASCLQCALVPPKILGCVATPRRTAYGDWIVFDGKDFDANGVSALALLGVKSSGKPANHYKLRDVFQAPGDAGETCTSCLRIAPPRPGPPTPSPAPPPLRAAPSCLAPPAPLHN